MCVFATVKFALGIPSKTESVSPVRVWTTCFQNRVVKCNKISTRANYVSI